jgi:hypothetical protein
MYLLSHWNSTSRGDEFGQDTDIARVVVEKIVAAGKIVQGKLSKEVIHFLSDALDGLGCKTRLRMGGDWIGYVISSGTFACIGRAVDGKATACTRAPGASGLHGAISAYCEATADGRAAPLHKYTVLNTATSQAIDVSAVARCEGRSSCDFTQGQG